MSSYFLEFLVEALWGQGWEWVSSEEESPLLLLELNLLLSSGPVETNFSAESMLVVVRLETGPTVEP